MPRQYNYDNINNYFLKEYQPIHTLGYKHVFYLYIRYLLNK